MRNGNRTTRAFLNEHLKDRTHAYKIDGAFNFTPDPDTPIQNRHPIFITHKDKLNLGHFGNCSMRCSLKKHHRCD